MYFALIVLVIAIVGAGPGLGHQRHPALFLGRSQRLVEPPGHERRPAGDQQQQSGHRRQHRGPAQAGGRDACARRTVPGRPAGIGLLMAERVLAVLARSLAHRNDADLVAIFFAEQGASTRFAGVIDRHDARGDFVIL